MIGFFRPNVWEYYKKYAIHHRNTRRNSMGLTQHVSRWTTRLASITAGLLLFTLAPAAKAGGILPASGPAPYPPVESALSTDQMSYDDGTMKVRIETSTAFDTKIYYVHVDITDPSQLRTALSAQFPAKALRPVDLMAAENRAVLAINGDFFSYHQSGFVVRNGEVLRRRPRKERDTLIIDDKGDFTIIAPTSQAALDAYAGTVRDAFCFGPGLIINGLVQTFDAHEKVSCDANNPAQRIAIGQKGPLSYLIVATEGPQQAGMRGVNLKEFTQLLLDTGVPNFYNLDGGSSVTIMLCGNRINAPETKNRYVGDIIYFATTAAPGGNPAAGTAP